MPLVGDRSQDSFGGAISADGLAAPTADGCDLGTFELQLRLHASPTRLVQGAAAPTGQLSGYGFSAGD